MTIIQGTHVPAAAFVPAAFQPAIVDPFLADPIQVSPIRVDDERPEEAAARESLLDRAFGPARFRKTCHKLRAGRLPARGLSLVARVTRLGGGADVSAVSAGSEIVGTVRLWHVEAGGTSALMLGPLAVDARYRSFGVGARLMRAAIARAHALGHAAILLVGDAPYYARFGFDRAHTRALIMPGPVEDARFLGLELVPGALAQAEGLVRATGALELSRPRPRRQSLDRAA